jgi:DNA-binding beta-propeller fold protein YncE
VALPGPANRFDYTSIDVRRRPDDAARAQVERDQAARVHVRDVEPTSPAIPGLAYDPVERHVFVCDEAGGVETVLDAEGRRVASVQLGGEAGNVQYDTGSHRILVDLQSKNEVAVVDPATNRVVRRVRVACDHDHSLLVDSSHRLAFVACDGDAKLLTLDLRRMKVTQSASVGADPDVLAFDAGAWRLYVAVESGDVAVFAESAHGVRKLGQSSVDSSAHSVAVDPQTHLVYFPLERGSGGRPQLLIMSPRWGSSLVRGTTNVQ